MTVVNENRINEAVTGITGVILGLVLGVAIVFAFTPAVAPYTMSPPGIVMGAADLTFDGGATRTYRLIIRGDQDGLPYTVHADKATYEFFTERLGRSWPRE